ncbi:MAG: hypothetical protein AAB947_01115, partial [Patescibacteria group bacterium]
INGLRRQRPALCAGWVYKYMKRYLFIAFVVLASIVFASSAGFFGAVVTIAPDTYHIDFGAVVVADNVSISGSPLSPTFALPPTPSRSFIFTAPVTGQTIQQGSNVVITWSKTGTWGSVHDPHRVIEFDLIRISDGAKVKMVSNTTNFFASSKIWSLSVGSGALTPGQYKLRGGVHLPMSSPLVSGYSYPTHTFDYVAESSVFTIVAAVTNAQPVITFTQPQGGETVKVGTNFNIKWNSINTPVGASVNLRLVPSASNATFTSNEFGEILEVASVSETYSWFIFEDIIVYADLARALGYPINIQKGSSRVMKFPPAGSYKFRVILVDSVHNVITSADSATFMITQ